MKANKSIIYYRLLLFIGLSILISSCYKRLVPEYDYSEFRRVIGREGGDINFYEYNPQDSIPKVLVKMHFPEDALDSFVVFNMYEFYDQQTYIDLLLLNKTEESKFLYFIPFYESEGYNEQSQSETNYHLSILFNKAVTITYNLSNYPINESSKLYKILIPQKDTWDDNVWVNWSNQGYPDGYDDLDLIYLITGRWTELNAWGTGNPSLHNWIEIPEESYVFNPADSTLTFDIYDTDYMYVMGKPTVK
jgi:hypothetical protein